MRATFTLGRIAGVRIGVHWSVLFIFGVVAFGLAQGRLPQVYPGHSPVLYWVAGLGAAVVFFASLLAHELAHAVVARHNGVAVDDIVLWLLGGVARLKSEASSPAAELRIAGVGPLVSLLLGGLFLLGTWLLALASAPRLLVEVTAWLAGINLLLAVFNALPAAPLDGGRLLRAFLWWRTGDRLRATAGATAAGRGLGWLVIALGLVMFLRGGGFGGLWLALIGWFLIAAATAEGRQAQLRGVLAGVPVRDAMTRDPLTVPAVLPVADMLADPRYRYRHSAFPVTGADGATAGLVTLDGARQVTVGKRGTVTVGEVMVPLSRTTVAGPDDSLADLLPRMEPGAEHRVLVMDEGGLVGILSLSDVSRTVTWLMNPGRGR
ncbi:zinc metalloprotease [Streptomyces hygroscopicus subsp. hygroscopicus]|uniref:site-2 protease family protein n=1 Tax=Streptomyces sp. KHY 26 TaxID=3097359 RepID=UPI0024A47887|nr:site-2 protease family protein [Streptomyces hygroscopicus]GLX50371.1 zinc metalloprotease [Streptomyces hygroscopicus subsp. hygroscopicus]